MGAARKQEPDPSYEWFTRADLRRYRGKYIAIVGRRVVASGTHANPVLAKAERRFPGQKILFWKVIEGDLLSF